MSYIRIVHNYKAKEKIVMCPVDHQCLFPSASSFIEGSRLWEDRQIRGCGCRGRAEAVSKLADSLGQQFPGYEIVSPCVKLHTGMFPHVAQIRFRPQIKQPHGLKPDIIITPRKRNSYAHKNWPYWQEVVDYIKGLGLTVGIVGQEDTCFQLKNIDMCSWDYGGLEASVEMMMNSKLVVSTNTGPLHLAIFLERPTIAIMNAMGCVYEMERQRNPAVFFKKTPPDLVSVTNKIKGYFKIFL